MAIRCVSTHYTNIFDSQLLSHYVLRVLLLLDIHSNLNKSRPLHQINVDGVVIPAHIHTFLKAAFHVFATVLVSDGKP